MIICVCIYVYMCVCVCVCVFVCVCVCACARVCFCVVVSVSICLAMAVVWREAVGSNQIYPCLVHARLQELCEKSVVRQEYVLNETGHVLCLSLSVSSSLSLSPIKRHAH